MVKEIRNINGINSEKQGRGRRNHSDNREVWLRKLRIYRDEEY